MKLTIVANQQAVAKTAADRFVALAAEAITARGRFIVALSGGSTPKALYEVLRAFESQALVDWARIECFVGDERMVPASDQSSNLGLAQRELFDHLDYKPVAYAVPTDAAGETAAGRYAELIREHVPAGDDGTPVFDLVLLGLGSDGHTASLFPGIASLRDTDALVIYSKPGTLPPPVERVSFTLPLINSARSVVMMAAGEDKREALGLLLEQLDEPAAEGMVPAARVRPVSGAFNIIVDEAAAGRSADELSEN